MIKHVVMYKLKDNSCANKKKLQEKFLSMKGKINVLKSIESGTDFLKIPRSFDVVLICTFETKEDMKIYDAHPVHLPVKEYVKSVVVKSHSVDFEY